MCIEVLIWHYYKVHFLKMYINVLRNSHVLYLSTYCHTIMVFSEILYGYYDIFIILFNMLLKF